MDAPAVGYLRVSTTEQAREGVSLAAQQARIVAYCAASGLSVIKIVRDEGVSGARPLRDRPGGAELVRLLAKKKALHIVSLKLDRLFRDASDALVQTRTWDKAGVALHVLDLGGQSLNSASAMGRMFLTVAAGFAELERNLIGERTATAMRYKRDRREAYSPTPFGFVRVGNQLVEDAKEMAVVRRIRAWRRNGWTLRRIAERLSATGIPTKQGGMWAPATVRYLLGNVALYDRAP